MNHSQPQIFEMTTQGLVRPEVENTATSVGLPAAARFQRNVHLAGNARCAPAALELRLVLPSHGRQYSVDHSRQVGVRNMHEGARHEQGVHGQRCEIEPSKITADDLAARLPARQLDQALRALETNRRKPPAPEPGEVPPRPAADVQHPAAGLKPPGERSQEGRRIDVISLRVIGPVVGAVVIGRRCPGIAGIRLRSPAER